MARKSSAHGMVNPPHSCSNPTTRMTTMKTKFKGALCLLLFCVSVSMAEEGWQPLFNGKDLAGWRPNFYPASWSVVDGAIRAHATAESSHLFYVGNEPTGKFVAYTNFVLELSARGETNSNSGIYFHTDYLAPNSKHHLANGYEVQLDSNPKAKRKTGSLYGVVDLTKGVVNETKWFLVRITVQGKRIMVEVNDRKVIDYTEFTKVERPASMTGRKVNPLGGAIALQAH